MHMANEIAAIAGVVLGARVRVRSLVVGSLLTILISALDALNAPVETNTSCEGWRRGIRPKPANAWKHEGELSGIRSSWLVRARNLVFALQARSASR